jgi:NAD-dependent DNA ligase
LPYDIDGVVYKVNAIAEQNSSALSRARRAGRWRTSFRRRR